MAFQRIAERDFAAVRDIFSDWIGEASLLEERAILAALAHPPILKSADNVRFSLEIAEKVLSNLLTLDKASRKRDDFRVLRQGLEYALSVFVAHLPAEGFAFLRRWAEQDDIDIKRIVRANLGRSRLTKKHGDEVRAVLAILSRGCSCSDDE
ncbi:MAG: hypothetical protein M1358_17965 [Chloroflexi bacterium]|nr:hypothetical protein [Chloroflexota bacterium]